MNLIPLQTNQRNDFFRMIDIQTERLKKRRHSVPLDRTGPSFNGVAEDMRTNSLNKTEVTIKRKLSSLRGKVTTMSVEEIDKRLKSLRNEWQRDI